MIKIRQQHQKEEDLASHQNSNESSSKSPENLSFFSLSPLVTNSVIRLKLTELQRSLSLPLFIFSNILAPNNSTLIFGHNELFLDSESSKSKFQIQMFAFLYIASFLSRVNVGLDLIQKCSEALADLRDWRYIVPTSSRREEEKTSEDFSIKSVGILAGP
uniref:Uncharacterized protein n=1 Tax=Glossina brevipalpis TaxID=37001 RepID=A0A1A9WVV2_9MUSC